MSDSIRRVSRQSGRVIGAIMDGRPSQASYSTAARTAAVLVAGAVLLVGMSACGSDSKSTTSAGSSTTVVKKEAGLAKLTNLTVVNKSGRDIVIDICHDGVCIGNKTLKDGESDQAAGDNINGWVKYAWGIGTGAEPFRGLTAALPGPYQVDFTAGNPDIGLPWIEARLPKNCSSFTGDPSKDKPAQWYLDVGDVLQSRGDSLCTYSMVGSRQPDGGNDRVTGAPADYKMLKLEAYAPDAFLVSSRGCTWEHTPGPAINPESPDGSWSCWKPGPKPPSGTAVTKDAAFARARDGTWVRW